MSTNTKNDLARDRTASTSLRGSNSITLIRSRRPWIFCVVGVLLLVLARNAGRLLEVDAPQKSDVILVLAGETDHRVERGLQLLEQGYGRTLIINVPASARVYGLTEIQLAQQFIERLHPNGPIRICPIEGLSTKEETWDAEKCLQQWGGDRVLIVTSDFHTRRALSIFRRELPHRSFSIAAVYDATQFGSSWWKHRQWAKTCLDEWLRLSWWNAVDRWR